MTKNPVLVSVEIKPYLVDYCRYYYGNDPIIVSKTDLFPFIHDQLSRPPLNYRPVKDSEKKLTFQLPWNKVRDIRKLNYITPRKYKLFNTYFYHLFKNHFVTYMNKACIDNNLPYKTAIISFMEETSISYDRFQYDSLKRIYLRYRKKNAKNGKKIL